MRIRNLLLALVLLLTLTGHSAEGNITTNSRQGLAPISAEFRPELPHSKPGSHLGFSLRFLEILVRNGFSYTDPYGEIFAAYFLLELYKDFQNTLDEMLISEIIQSRASIEAALQKVRQQIRILEAQDPCSDRLKLLRKLEEELEDALNEKIERHHLLPRQFADKFRDPLLKRGLGIDDFIVELPKENHKLVHGKGGGEAWENSWNKQWEKFFEANQDPTFDEIMEFLERLKRDFGIL